MRRSSYMELAVQLWTTEYDKLFKLEAAARPELLELVRKAVEDDASTWRRQRRGAAGIKRHEHRVEQAALNAAAQIQRLANQRNIPIIVAARSLSWLMSMARSKQWKEEQRQRRLLHRSTTTRLLHLAHLDHELGRAIVLLVRGDGQTVLRLRDTKKKYNAAYKHVLIGNGDFHSFAHFMFGGHEMFFDVLTSWAAQLLGKKRVQMRVLANLETNNYYHVLELLLPLTSAIYVYLVKHVTSPPQHTPLSHQPRGVPPPGQPLRRDRARAVPAHRRRSDASLAARGSRWRRWHGA